MVDKPCRVCQGEGRVKRERTLAVQIPAGVEDGTRIRLAGEGEAGGRGAPAGDLYIFLTVTPHRFFKRDGNNVHVRVPIPMTTAALGGAIEVPTLGGSKAEIELPEGTQHGKTFRLRGKGVKGLRSSYPGDLYCHVSVETPVKLTEHQRKLLRELDESFRKGGERHSPNAKSWADRVKDLFK
jgi:molecular chaperone DnaJ